jgi:hypothetical protein
MFQDFRTVRTQARFLNLRIYPGIRRLARTRVARRLDRRLGWHLCIEAVK